MFSCFHDEQPAHWCEHESTELGSHQTAKCFSFFFFRRASSKLHDSFTMVFAWNSSILHWAVHQPIAFHNFEVSRGGLNLLVKNYGFINNTIFKNLRMCTNHLATKQLLFQIVELEIRLCAWRQGESLASIVDSVFGESLVNDSSADTALHLLRKPMRTDLLLCDGTSAQACTCF